MTHWLTLDDWDTDGIPKRVRCDCKAGEDHHQMDVCSCDYGAVAVGVVEPPTVDLDCSIHAVPAPLQPWEPLTDEDRLKVDEWIGEFFTTLPVDPPAPAKWLTVEDLQEAMRKVREADHPRRTEPIKLTPGQWALLPQGDPRIPQYARPLGDLLGIPVVMVESEEESTPVAEGWVKPPPLRPDPDLVWQVEGHMPTIRKLREAAERALHSGRLRPNDPPRRWWHRLLWWQK